jgi:arabinan endo-1,5-alpha-L-arabinosidase
MKTSERLLVCVLLTAGVFLSACKKPSDDTTVPNPGTNPNPGTTAFDINSISDTYGSVAPFANRDKWGPYNLHDPSVIKSGEWFYSFSTDVGYGITIRPGIQIRKSKDLVEWFFVGWVFDNLPAMGSQFITGAGGTPFQSLWAPYVMKVGSEFRLYYSLSCAVLRLSVIGLATATNPEGPWTEKGLVVTSRNDQSTQTNAIDPAVVVTPGGDHWFYYGSAWDGIYILKLNPATGLAQTSNDKGIRIAQRGFTGGTINGNIEGAEVIYNSTLNKYFMFIAYDWLETKYNVRVGRSDSPQGPFRDFNNNDINIAQDHGPMILAPYKFSGHSGWQGVAHCSVFSDNGQYYMMHQGRPGVDKFYMDMHVRKIFWTQDGWPVVSPERYAWEKDSLISRADITGDWEQIILGYNVVPGFANEQTFPDFQNSVPLTINANGNLNGSASNTWTYNAPWLTMTWSNGFTDKVYVQKGRDWENKKNTIIFSGLNNQGTAIWGKKK